MRSASEVAPQYLALNPLSEMGNPPVDTKETLTEKYPGFALIALHWLDYDLANTSSLMP